MKQDITVEEGNELIDVFMGVSPSDRIFLAQYNSNWTHLMPVVTKCFVANGNSGFALFNAADFYSGNIFNIWESVVKFIQWYNANNKK